MQRYHVFETAAGFCGIAWGEAGITRFQLPARSAEAAERLLRRRLPDAEPATPTAEVAEAIAAARRYFAGEPVDFAGVRVDLGEQEPFFARVYAAVRRLGWGETTTYGALARDARRRAGGGARRRAGDGAEPGAADRALPPGARRRRQARRLLRARRRGHQAADARARGRRPRAAAAAQASFGF